MYICRFFQTIDTTIHELVFLFSPSVTQISFRCALRLLQFDDGSFIFVTLSKLEQIMPTGSDSVYLGSVAVFGVGVDGGGSGGGP